MNDRLRGAVEALSAQTRVESSHIGDGGSPSEVYAKYRAVASVATREESLALLAHPSPIVRSYMATHVIQDYPADMSALTPLFADDTGIDTMDGCIVSRDTVAARIASQLAWSKDPHAIEVLAAVATASDTLPTVRSTAIGTLARLHDARTRDAALSSLDARDPEVAGAALRALGMISDTSSDARIQKFANDSRDDVRAAAASALGAMSSTSSRDKLVSLFDDKVDYVRRSAASAYARHAQAESATLERLLHDRDKRLATLTEESLAKRTDDASLPLLEAALMRVDHVSGETMQELAKNPRPALTLVMRRLLRARDWSVRSSAATYVGEVRDTDSVPALRELLHAATIHERQHAAQSLAKLGAREAIPELEALLHDSNPYGRIAGAEALAALKSRASLPAVERATETETGWSKPNMEKALAALRNATAN